MKKENYEIEIRGHSNPLTGDYFNLYCTLLLATESDEARIIKGSEFILDYFENYLNGVFEIDSYDEDDDIEDIETQITLIMNQIKEIVTLSNLTTLFILDKPCGEKEFYILKTLKPVRKEFKDLIEWHSKDIDEAIFNLLNNKYFRSDAVSGVRYLEICGKELVPMGATPLYQVDEFFDVIKHTKEWK